MKIKINFLDNILDFNETNIYSLEIYNKKYLYRISDLFYQASIGNLTDELIFYNNGSEESIANKIYFCTNFFDFQFNSKQSSNDLLKHIIKNLDIYDKDVILKDYNKLYQIVNKEIKKIDLPVKINQLETIDEIIKLFKINIDEPSELIDNLLLLIDYIKELNINKVLCFINLKIYLTLDELKELYKYARYNDVKLILIDYFKREYIKEYEKILIIDENLEEIVV